MLSTLTHSLRRKTPRSTPAGVGFSKKPPRRLRDGDEFRVSLTHGVGTLINKIVLDK